MLALLCLLACPTPDKDVDPDTGISESRPDDSATDDSAIDDTAPDDTSADDTAPDDTAPDDTADDTATDDTGSALVSIDLGASGVSLWSMSHDEIHNGYYAGAGGFTAINAGDTNGDGHPDLVLGDYWRDPTYPSVPAGGAYLWEGPVTGMVRPDDAARDWRGHCNGQGLEWQDGSNFGFAMAALGDVNGDGYDDLAIASPEDSVDCDYDITGAVDVFLGSASGTPTSIQDTVTIRGERGSSLFDVAGVPDTDGDGNDELLVGEIGDRSVYLIRDVDGATTLPDDADLSLVYAESGDRYFGSVVEYAGDTNGDGLPELLAGSYGPVNGSEGQLNGIVWLFDGTASGTIASSDADSTIESTATRDYFGSDVATDDLNGDGYDDVIVGAWGDSTNGADAGAVYLFTGPLTGSLAPSDALQVLHGDASERFGASVDGAGDLDGDGDDEAVIGAWLSSRVHSQGGAAWVLRDLEAGTFDVADADTIHLYGGADYVVAGRSVRGAGDLDGDGRDDMLISTGIRLTTGTSVLGAYVVYGGDL